MELPRVNQKGFLAYGSKEIYLNHCTTKEIQEIFGKFEICRFSDEEMSHFVIVNDLGEFNIYMDNKNGLVLEIYLELFEDLTLFKFFLQSDSKCYKYLDFMGDNYLVLSKYMVTRLRKDLVAGLIFFNHNFLRKEVIGFFSQINQASRALAKKCGEILTFENYVMQ